MGANLVYLNKPNKKKEMHEGASEQFDFTLAAMQGWRVNMVSTLSHSLMFVPQEDAHISMVNFDNQGGSLFGIFDGHGGVEVAEYCKRNLPSILLRQPEYQTKDYATCFQNSFLLLDAMLYTEDGKQQLEQI